MTITSIKTEEVSNIQTKLNIEVSTESVEKSVEAKLSQIAKTAKIDGFRPGKVPMARIRSQYGVGVQQEVINELINNSVFDAIDQEKLRAVAAPSIEDVKLEEKTLSFTAVVDVAPNVDVTGLDALELERKSAEVDDAAVDEMIDSLRKQRQVFVTKEGAIVNGDQAVFDFEGSVDGELFEGGAASDFELEIGSNRFIPGFEDGMVGLAAGDVKDIDVTFPEDYQAEHLAGKAAVFKVTVKEVKETQLPEIDEEFLKLFNITEGGVEKLKADVRKNMEREIKHAARNQLKGAAFEAVLAANEVELPQAMIDQEVERQRDMAIQRMSQQFGGGAANIDKSMLPAELFTEQAVKSSRLGVLVASIIDNNELTVDAERVEAYIAEMAQNYEQPEEVIEFYKNDKQQRAQVESVILEDQVVDFIASKAKVTDVAVSYQELLAEVQQQQQG